MRFNMGCGQNHLPGYVNVDAFSEAAPDEVWDLEKTPWPWPDSCASEIKFIHSLEHMGADAACFMSIIKELYRISSPGCITEIHVPHPRHDDFLNDPTHVRPITPQVLSLFDLELNARWKSSGASNSTLALYTGVDFKIREVITVLDEPYRSQLANSTTTEIDVRRAIQMNNNVIKEFRIKIEARKSI